MVMVFLTSAEGTGFEPVPPLRKNSFRDCRFEPLSQPSALKRCASPDRVELSSQPSQGRILSIELRRLFFIVSIVRRSLIWLRQKLRRQDSILLRNMLKGYDWGFSGNFSVIQLAALSTQLSPVPHDREYSQRQFFSLSPSAHFPKE